MIKWTPQYAVGVKIIDAQHQKFFGTFNELYDAFLRGDAKDKLVTVLHELSDYADYHFAVEENYFDEFKYEGAEEHLLQHMDFRTQIFEFKKHFFREDDLERLAGELVELLDYWLVKHVVEMDQKYVPCFKEHGLE
ncbi:bacteriohemerythrin [Patescibacteria group bacterium]|nr:MAG: bacteriohemerythrin [Patescibacteria group bacterium]